MDLIVLLAFLMVLAALWTVMTSLLLRAALGLALTSVLLAIIMFQMESPLAGAFELSVCAGLISVIFISVITLTHRLPRKEYLARRANRMTRFWFLPLILLVVGLGLYFRPLSETLNVIKVAPGLDVRAVLWDERKVDLFGQILAILAGVYGVVILFKGQKNGK